MKTQLTVVAFLALVVGISRTSAVPHQDHDDKPKNLKVLPKDISEEDLHMTMRMYSKSLGVRCGYCHVLVPGDKPSLDFASDEKPTKLIAREMIKMTADINKKYLANIGHGDFEAITCVSCHNGNEKPMISVDSLPKKPMPPGGMPPGGMPPGNRADSTQRK